MKFSFFCICLFVSWISCSTNSGTSGVLRNDSLYVVDVDHAEREKVLFMSSLFQKANAIVLDTSVWIGSLDKIQGLNNRIFILDRHQAKGVFEFTRDGVFVRQIGSRGNGPGEYIVPGDFSLDMVNGRIYILDDQKQTISQYNISDGKFQKTIALDKESGIRSHRIQWADGSLFVDLYCFDEQPATDGLLRRIDLSTAKSDGVYMSSAYNKQWHDPERIDSKVFYPGEKNAYRFVKQFMDTVFYIGSQGVMPYMALQSEDLLRPQDLKVVDMNSRLPLEAQLFQTKKIYGIHDYREHNHVIYFRYMKGGTIVFVAFDTRTGNTTLFDLMTDDLLFSENAQTLMPQFGCSTGEGEYYYFNNAPFINLKGWVEGGVLSPTLEGLDKLKVLNENSNPVIFYYEYKN